MNSRCRRMLGPFSDITDLCHCKMALYVCSRKKPCFHEEVACVTCMTTRLFICSCMVCDHGENQQWVSNNQMTWHQLIVFNVIFIKAFFFLKRTGRKIYFLLYFLNQRRFQLYWPGRNLICKTRSILHFRCSCGNSGILYGTWFWSGKCAPSGLNSTQS